MKTIYKSLMTIAFAGLSLASCDKELKEETAMEVGVVTDSNVSFDGKTVTVKKGNPVTFSFDGDPDFITFFSGEIDHEYKFRNRESIPYGCIIKHHRKHPRNRENEYKLTTE